MAIQEYLTAAIQNIAVLIRYARNPRRSMAAMLPELRKAPQVIPDRLRNRLLSPDFFGCEFVHAALKQKLRRDKWLWATARGD